ALPPSRSLCAAEEVWMESRPMEPETRMDMEKSIGGWTVEPAGDTVPPPPLQPGKPPGAAASRCPVDRYFMIRAIFSVAAALLLAAPAATAADPGPAVSAPYFGIRVVDSETGRGVPLV